MDARPTSTFEKRLLKRYRDEGIPIRPTSTSGKHSIRRYRNDWDGRAYGQWIPIWELLPWWRRALWTVRSWFRND